MVWGLRAGFSGLGSGFRVVGGIGMGFMRVFLGRPSNIMASIEYCEVWGGVLEVRSED